MPAADTTTLINNIITNYIGKRVSNQDRRIAVLRAWMKNPSFGRESLCQSTCFGSKARQDAKVWLIFVDNKIRSQISSSRAEFHKLLLSIWDDLEAALQRVSIHKSDNLREIESEVEKISTEAASSQKSSCEAKTASSPASPSSSSKYSSPSDLSTSSPSTTTTSKDSKKNIDAIDDSKPFLDTSSTTPDMISYNKLLEYASTLERRNQKLRDQQRIERKIRDSYRFENAVSEYAKKLAELLTTHAQTFQEYTPRVPALVEDANAPIGVLQISDAHLNEFIDLQHNYFDFTEAAKRLQKFVSRATRIFKAENISKVLVAFTGDLINSDRRTDELLNNSTNRAKATLLAVDLFMFMLADLHQHFQLSVLAVAGNESRIDLEHSTSEIVLTNNFDFMIDQMLNRLCAERFPDIHFFSGSFDKKVVKVNNQNLLFLHGTAIKPNSGQSIQNLIAQYSFREVFIHHVIHGHIHGASITDISSRSSSLCGGNAYSDSLGFVSRASQNIYIVREDSIDGMRIDLQNADAFEGYEIDLALEAYDAKSAKKIKEKDAKYYVIGTVC